MLNKIVIATTNKHKFDEMRTLFDEGVLELLPLSHDAPEAIEDGDTFLKNALIKAYSAFNYTKIPSLADDSGICVEALNGSPGVHSARYGGVTTSPKEKIEILLANLKDSGLSRRAYFITSAVLVLSDEYYIATEGIVYGEILREPRGQGGFGYDPIFLPEGYDKSYAELSFLEKNNMSHRAIAIRKMTDILSKIYKKS